MSDKINNKYMKSLFRECNLRTMKVKEFYDLVLQYHKEGKSGKIRFPIWLRDLHRRLTGDYNSSKIIITNQLIDILNNPSLEYCDKIIRENL